MMDWQTVEDQCFKDNKFFSQLVGVWPDQERVTKLVTRLVILVLVIIALITEVSFFSFEMWPIVFHPWFLYIRIFLT